jgi:ABC-type amino acid transport substrate-binding protein
MRHGPFTVVLAVWLGLWGVAIDGTAQTATRPNFKTIEPGVLIVSVTNTPPSIIVNPDNSLDGIQGAIVNQLAVRHGLKVRPFVTTFAGKLTSVQQGRADIGTGAYWTPERSKVLYFSQADRADPVFWILKKSTPYEGAQSLAGKKIGVSQGQAEVPYLQRAHGKDNVVFFGDDATGQQAVMNGQVAAYMAGAGAVLRAAQFTDLKAVRLKVGDFGMPPEQVLNATRLFVACDNKGLGAAINEVIDSMRQTGELRKVIARIFPDPDSLMLDKDVPADNCS